MAEPKTWFLNATDRITNQTSVSAGEVAGDRDTGETFRRTSSGWSSLGLGGGGGSGVPGTPVAQPTVTASTTASAIISLSQPAKGVRLVVVNKDAGTATTPTAADGYFNVVFDPPSDLIKADWLNETLAGPRHRVTTKQALEIYFQDSAGTALTVSTFAHAASQTNANISLAVEAIV